MTPRGVRNFNPGNLRWGDPWQGLVPPVERTDKDFCQFIKPCWGIRAIAVTLITYQDKYSIVTIRMAITRWAPATENDTEAYIDAVSASSGFAADETLDFQKYACLAPIVRGIIRHENGIGPKAGGRWYDAVTFDEGLKLAGVIRPAKTALSAPGGTAIAVSGGAGVVAAAVSGVQQVQPLVAAVTGSETGMTNIDRVLKIVGAVLVIGAIIAAVIAYWRKHRAVKAVQP